MPTYQFLHTAVKIFEKQFILDALIACNWKKPKTARYLGIGLSTLYKKIVEHKIKRRK